MHTPHYFVAYRAPIPSHVATEGSCPPTSTGPLAAAARNEKDPLP